PVQLGLVADKLPPGQVGDDGRAYAVGDAYQVGGVHLQQVDAVAERRLLNVLFGAGQRVDVVVAARHDVRRAACQPLDEQRAGAAHRVEEEVVRLWVGQVDHRRRDGGVQRAGHVAHAPVPRGE